MSEHSVYKIYIILYLPELGFCTSQHNPLFQYLLQRSLHYELSNILTLNEHIRDYLNSKIQDDFNSLMKQELLIDYVLGLI